MPTHRPNRTTEMSFRSARARDCRDCETVETVEKSARGMSHATTRGVRDYTQNPHRALRVRVRLANPVVVSPSRRLTTGISLWYLLLLRGRCNSALSLSLSTASALSLSRRLSLSLSLSALSKTPALRSLSLSLSSLFSSSSSPSCSRSCSFSFGSTNGAGAPLSRLRMDAFGVSRVFSSATGARPPGEVDADVAPGLRSENPSKGLGVAAGGSAARKENPENAPGGAGADDVGSGLAWPGRRALRTRARGGGGGGGGVVLGRRIARFAPRDVFLAGEFRGRRLLLALERLLLLALHALFLYLALRLGDLRGPVVLRGGGGRDRVRALGRGASLSRRAASLSLSPSLSPPRPCLPQRRTPRPRPRPPSRSPPHRRRIRPREAPPRSRPRRRRRSPPSRPKCRRERALGRLPAREALPSARPAPPERRPPRAKAIR